MMEWQPIESAPKDGTAILGYFGMTAGDEPPDMSVVRFMPGVEGGWHEPTFPTVELDEPTHWMPLPSPPDPAPPRVRNG